MSQSQSTVLKLYLSVIEDVIAGVRESFLDEGVDEQVLQELKQIWETKLISSKAVEVSPDPPEPQPPPLGMQKAAILGNQIFGQIPGSVLANQQAQGIQHSQMQQAAQVPQQTQQTVIVADPNRQVPIQITLPAPAGGDSQPRILTIQVPASALQGNQLHSLLSGPILSATMSLPPHVASTMLQQHINASLQGQAASAIHLQQAAPAQAIATTDRQQFSQGNPIRQLDGPLDSSDDDDDEDEEDNDAEDDDDDNDEKDDDDNEEDNNEGQEEDPLNSGDDVSDEDPSDLFDTDNVVVCQYDKITRSRNKWKFYLKDGIMNLNGKDFVFQKANGDAEW